MNLYFAKTYKEQLLWSSTAHHNLRHNSFDSVVSHILKVQGYGRAAFEMQWLSFTRNTYTKMYQLGIVHEYSEDARKTQFCFFHLRELHCFILTQDWQLSITWNQRHSSKVYSSQHKDLYRSQLCSPWRIVKLPVVQTCQII